MIAAPGGSTQGNHPAYALYLSPAEESVAGA